MTRMAADMPPVEEVGVLRCCQPKAHRCRHRLVSRLLLAMHSHCRGWRHSMRQHGISCKAGELLGLPRPRWVKPKLSQSNALSGSYENWLLLRVKQPAVHCSESARDSSKQGTATVWSTAMQCITRHSTCRMPGAAGEECGRDCGRQATLLAGSVWHANAMKRPRLSGVVQTTN